MTVQRRMALTAFLQGVAFAILTVVLDSNGIVLAMVAGALFGGFMYLFARRRMSRTPGDLPPRR